MRLRRVLTWAATGLTLAAGLAACQHLRLAPEAGLPGPPAEGMRIATWNVHYILVNQAEGRWGRAGWEARKGPLDATFKALESDIVAFQEMESFSGGNDDSDNLARNWLLRNNPEYAAAAVGDWRDFPSTQPVLYRKERFDVLDQGWFFFSGTPDVIYARSFDGRYPAFASWVRFRDLRNGAALRLVNVHFDAGSRLNRRLSADLVARRIRPWIDAGEAVVLAGDLNALHGSRIHDRLQSAGLTFPKVPGATYHLDRGINLLPAIDFIGGSPAVAILRGPDVFGPPPDPVWPSDHYPVVLDVAPRPDAEPPG